MRMNKLLGIAFVSVFVYVFHSCKIEAVTQVRNDIQCIGEDLFDEKICNRKRFVTINKEVFNEQNCMGLISYESSNAISSAGTKKYALFNDHKILKPKRKYS